MSRNFDVSLEKGAVGERICRQYLERKGWVVYQPMTDGAHAFDMLAIKNKERAIAMDVKAKARMNRWYATGINQRHFRTYEGFSNRHSMPFWLFFVDEHERRIYGNSIDALETQVEADGRLWPTVMTFKNVETRVWHLSQMLTLAVIDDQCALELAALNQRSYGYG